MSGEPQPARDQLDRSIFGLKVVWLGLVSGGLVTVIMFASIVWTGGGGVARLGNLRYLFLLPVPVGLVGAYLMVPRMLRSDPAALVHSGRSQGTVFEGWEATTPDDAYHWFPL